MKIEVLFLVCCVLIGEFVSCQNYYLSKSVGGALQEILKHYDNNEPPRPDEPTEIKIGVYIDNLLVNDGQLFAQFYMKQSWTDPRLAFAKSKRIQKTSLQASPYAIARIWKPDTYFKNEISSRKHELLTEQRLLKIQNDGSVFFVNHVSVWFNCPMQFSKFPFDIQTCSMCAESFGQTKHMLFFSFLEKPIQLAEDLQLPSWIFVDYVLQDCSRNYTAGSYACLEFRLNLRRDIGYFILRIYLPSILVVLLSWITFWIDRKASTARMNLGLATIILMAILCIAVDSLKPKVFYITVIDIWIWICVAFVCLALVEFVVVQFLGNRGASQESEDDVMDMMKRYSNDKKPVSTFKEKLMCGAAKLDLICRIVFLILFLIFNVIYWVVYSI